MGVHLTAKDKGVHIIASHFEYDRIVKPMLDKYPVERLVILSSPSGNLCKAADCPRAKEVVEYFVEKIQDYPIDVQEIPVDFTNFEDILVKTSKAIQEAEDEDLPVYLNLSSAPTLALLGMMKAASIKSRDANIEMFFASPKSCLKSRIFANLSELGDCKDGDCLEEMKELHDLFLKSGTSVGVSDYVTIPIMPIPKASKTDKKIMNILNSNGEVTSIKELLKVYNDTYRDSIKRSSLQYRLKKLEENNYIITEREDRRLKISLSHQGLIFAYTIRDIGE